MVSKGDRVVKPANPTKDGYLFNNWQYSGEEWSFINHFVTGDMALDATWNIITYNISYNLDGGTQNISNPSKYTVEDTKTLYAPTKTGYTFAGWYNGSTKLTNIAKGTYGDLTLTAHWSINSYNVTVTSSDTSKGTVSGSGTYAYNTSVTITATPIGDCVFKGWYLDSELIQKVSNDTTYTFAMSYVDTSFYARFFTKAEEEWNITHGGAPTITKDNKYITYGMYPQTNVNDSSLITILDTLTNQNEYGYYLYGNGYYYKYTATPFQSEYAFDNGTTIVSGTSYWFKVEPIKWVILDNEDGTYFVTTESLLINHMYNSYYSETQSKTDYQGNTGSAYANNYKYSDIRSWLNTNFYNQAFFLDNDNIKLSIVDNSVASTIYNPNKYACEDTNDKLFLLSAKELITAKYGFCTSNNDRDPTRTCKTTEYARAHGAYLCSDSVYLKNGVYSTRSPYQNSSIGINIEDHGYVSMNGVSDTCFGVRPAMRITLDK